jgi:hypothetical protein
MRVADFKKDSARMYTSIAANFFEGLNYAFIEASFSSCHAALCSVVHCTVQLGRWPSFGMSMHNHMS